MSETPQQIAARLGMKLQPGVTVQTIPRGESAYVLTDDARWLLKKHLHLTPAEQLKVRRNEFSRGFRIGKVKPKPKPRPTDRNEQVIILHERGMSDREIAAAVGLSHDGARKARLRLGLAPNKRHERKAG